MKNGSAVRKVDKKVAQKRKKASREKVSLTRTKKRRLTTADMEHFKQMLLEKRREILRNVSEIEDEALKKSRLDATGDLSSMPIHMADIGTDNYEQEFTLGLLESERQLLQEIDEALGRIADGTYGICMGTGQPITKARLRAKPWAKFCIDYARKIEQGLVTPPNQNLTWPDDFLTSEDG